MSNVLYQLLPWETVSNILRNPINLPNSVMLTRDWNTLAQDFSRSENNLQSGLQVVYKDSWMSASLL